MSNAQKIAAAATLDNAIAWDASRTSGCVADIGFCMDLLGLTKRDHDHKWMVAALEDDFEGLLETAEPQPR